jgi:hypothetical protein
VEVVGGAAGADGPVATEMVAVPAAELPAPPRQVTVSASTAAPPRSANPFLASDIIKSFALASDAMTSPRASRANPIDFVPLTVLRGTLELVFATKKEHSGNICTRDLAGAADPSANPA